MGRFARCCNAKWNQVETMKAVGCSTLCECLIEQLLLAAAVLPVFWTSGDSEKDLRRIVLLT